MNQGVVAVIVMAFFVPIAVVLAMNFDQLAGGSSDPDARPEGTLIYFYSPS